MYQISKRFNVVMWRQIKTIMVSATLNDYKLHPSASEFRSVFKAKSGTDLSLTLLWETRREEMKLVGIELKRRSKKENKTKQNWELCGLGGGDFTVGKRKSGGALKQNES